MLPTTINDANGEYEAIEPGTYEVQLKSIDLEISTEYKSDLRYQSAVLTWDVDGEEFREKFVKVSLHEKSKFFNRISSLLGRDLTPTDQVAWSVSPQATTNNTIDTYYKADKDEPENNAKKGDWVKTGEKASGVTGHLDDLLINGESILGRSCLLVLEVNDSGYNRAKAPAGSPLPKARRPKPVGAPA